VAFTRPERKNCSSQNEESHIEYFFVGKISMKLEGSAKKMS